MLKIESSGENALQTINHQVTKLDRLDGMRTNISHWKRKIMFFLTAIKVAFILDPSLPLFLEPKDDESDEVKQQCKIRQEDKIIHRGHIIDTLSDCLYDIYKSMKTTKEI